MTTRKDVEYMENEIQKNTKLSHDIYNCLIESIDNYYDNDIKKPIVNLDKATIKIFYLIKGMEDALIKEMDKHVNIVKIDVNNCAVGCDNAYYYAWYKCTQHDCDNDRIDQGDNYCSECGSKIYWVIEGDETLPAY